MGANRIKRVLVTDHVFGGLEIERSILGPVGAEIVVAPDTDEGTLTSMAASGVDGLLVCFAPVGENVVRAAGASGCKIIARYGIGVDNVDVETATELGIVVTRVPDYCLDEVADHTLALLLGAARGISRGQREIRQGGWTFPRDVQRLHGRRVALIGVGQIGIRVAARVGALGMQVVGFDPYLGDWPEAIERATSLEEAIADADVISLHAPLTEENRGLIGVAALAMTRRSPILINTARGGLVDLAAATAALDDGRLSAIAVDVVDPEPLPADHPLRDHPRAIVTPHMAFFSVEAERDLQRRTAEEVARVLEGSRPQIPVNPEVLSGRA